MRHYLRFVLTAAAMTAAFPAAAQAPAANDPAALSARLDRIDKQLTGATRRNLQGTQPFRSEHAEIRDLLARQSRDGLSREESASIGQRVDSLQQRLTAVLRADLKGRAMYKSLHREPVDLSQTGD